VDTPEVKARNLALNQAGAGPLSAGPESLGNNAFASRTNEHDATLFPCKNRDPLHFG
jgi:hypothetical protein